MVFLYNIENHFIYGVCVKKDQMHECRNVVRKSFMELKEELTKTIKWMDIDKDNYWPKATEHTIKNVRDEVKI